MEIDDYTPEDLAKLSDDKLKELAAAVNTAGPEVTDKWLANFGDPELYAEVNRLAILMVSVNAEMVDRKMHF